jgi:thiol-disulfide isomerase/thioredoxin
VIERAIIVVALAVVVLIGVLAARVAARRRVGAAMGMELPSDLAARLQGSGAGIIYFHGVHCADCRVQAAILSRLAGETGVSVAPVDAAREAEMASALAVMTVPSTVIVDRWRRVRAINLGFRGREALEAQLLGLS